MSRIIAFDVETPNSRNDRMSAIGITVIEDGAVTDEYYTLVDPETHFDPFNIQLTGISAETVKGAPTFPEVWQKIEPVLSGGLLCAHNAPFDLSVLRSCLRAYGIGLDHHHAGSDSRACAEILLRYLESGAEIRQFIRTCSLERTTQTSGETGR